MELKVEDYPMTDEKKMELWNKHFGTDPAATKQVNKGGGRTITAIDAYHQIREATEEWGPMGTWGLRNVSVTVDEAQLAHLVGEFFYPGGAFAVINSIDTWIRPKNGNHRRDDDWGKKLTTDTITKALSYLGFNADVFFGLFDSNRYVEERKQEAAKQAAMAVEKVYKKALDLLEEKKPLLTEDQYSKYKESLVLIQQDEEALKRASTILEGIIQEDANEQSS